MTEQLTLAMARSGAPAVSSQDVATVCHFLTGRDWTKASTIELFTHIDERRVRAIAEASDGMIISGPGCPGYKLLTDAAQLQEVDEAASRLESQARRMFARAVAIRRRAHRLLH